ncbi:MAG: aldolase/citrate lyase family protein, partial [Quisquiliibacterium sp.]
TQYGRVKDYVQRVEQELCLLVQIETREGMDNLEAICAVDGVDGVFIGPADLHASYGYVGQTANPEIVPVIEEGMRRIRKAGKAPGFLTPVEADAHRYLGVGAQFVAVGSDTGLLARGAEQLAARFKGG